MTDPQEYKYECQKCGTCCRHPWEVIIVKEDIQKWVQAGKVEYVENIQINPISISPVGLGDRRFGTPSIELVSLGKEVDQDSSNGDFDEKIRIIKEFVLKNHDYLGEGALHLSIYSYFSFFFPTATYFEDMGVRPIFSPKNFNIMLDGLKLGLQYILIFNAAGHCNFLKGNLCSIQELKPWACRNFPFNAEGKLRIEDKILNVCKGLYFTG